MTPLVRNLLLASLFAGIALSICLADRAPIHPSGSVIVLEPDFESFLTALTEHRVPGPHGYRLLVPYLVSYLSTFSSVPVIHVDFWLKFLFLVLLQYAFHGYLQNWIPYPGSLGPVVLLDLMITVAMTYPVGPSIVETSDLLNVLVFIIVCELVRSKRLFLLALVMITGIMNRETPLLLLPFIGLIYRNEKRMEAVLVGGICIIAYVSVRLLVSLPDSQWWSMSDMMKNIPLLSEQHLLTSLSSNAKLLFLLGPFVALAGYRFSQQPLFLRLSAISIPVFIIAHYVVGRISEVRLWIPLFVLLLPLAMRTILHSEETDTQSSVRHT